MLNYSFGNPASEGKMQKFARPGFIHTHSTSDAAHSGDFEAKKSRKEKTTNNTDATKHYKSL